MAAPTVQMSWWRLGLVLAYLASFAVCDDEFEGHSTLVVEHSFDNGPDPVFTRRGTITIRSITADSAHFTQEGSLSYEDREQLKLLSKEDGIYKIRVGTTAANDQKTQYVKTFVKACGLYESRLSDTLTVHFDQSGQLLGIGLTTAVPYCMGVPVADEELSSFNTSVVVLQSVTGPSPETQAFVQKQDQEKAEKAKGQQGDNRSFFAKYWMYIVPVVLIMMFANNADTGAGGGRG